MQLEVEGDAKSFAQSEAETAVDAGPVGTVQHQLHTAAVVEKALDYQYLTAGDQTEHGPGGGQVGDDLHGGRFGELAVLTQPTARPVGVFGGQVTVDHRPQLADLFGQLARAAGRLTLPERHGGIRPPGIDHADHPGLDTTNSPGVGAEQEHVPGHGLDGPLLVDGADEGVFGVGQDPILGQLGDGTTRGEGG